MEIFCIYVILCFYLFLKVLLDVRRKKAVKCNKIYVERIIIFFKCALGCFIIIMILLFTMIVTKNKKKCCNKNDA